MHAGSATLISASPRPSIRDPCSNAPPRHQRCVRIPSPDRREPGKSAHGKSTAPTANAPDTQQVTLPPVAKFLFSGMYSLKHVCRMGRWFISAQCSEWRRQVQETLRMPSAVPGQQRFPQAPGATDGVRVRVGNTFSRLPSDCRLPPNMHTILTANHRDQASSTSMTIQGSSPSHTPLPHLDRRSESPAG